MNIIELKGKGRQLATSDESHSGAFVLYCDVQQNNLLNQFKANIRRKLIQIRVSSLAMCDKICSPLFTSRRAADEGPMQEASLTPHATQLAIGIQGE
jgi:hypothetical protein